MIRITDFQASLYGSGVSEIIDRNHIVDATFQQNMFWEGKTVVKGLASLTFLDVEENYNIVNPASAFKDLKAYDNVKLSGFCVLADDDNNTKKISFDNWFLKEIEFSKSTKMATLYFEDVLGKFDKMFYDGYGLVKPATISGYYWRVVNANPYRKFPAGVGKPFLFEGTSSNTGNLWCAIKEDTFFNVLSRMSEALGVVLWADMTGGIMADWITLENLYMAGDRIFPNQEVEMEDVLDVGAVIIGSLGMPSAGIRYDFDGGQIVEERIVGNSHRFTSAQLNKTMEVRVPVDSSLFIKQYYPDKYNPIGYMYLDVDESGKASCYFGGSSVYYYIIPTQANAMLKYSGVVKGVIPLTEIVPLNQYIDEVESTDSTLTLDYPILQTNQMIYDAYNRYKNSPFRKKHIKVTVQPSRLDEVPSYPCKFRVKNPDNSVAYDTILHGIRHRFSEGVYSYDAFCVLV